MVVRGREWGRGERRGVVDQDVDRAEVTLDLFDGPFAASGVGQVEFDSGGATGDQGRRPTQIHRRSLRVATIRHPRGGRVAVWTQRSTSRVGQGSCQLRE